MATSREIHTPLEQRPGALGFAAEGMAFGAQGTQRPGLFLPAVFSLLAMLFACTTATAAGPKHEKVEPFRAYNLTLYGYNYTDTEIGSFEVNGAGGGNISVSTPTAGGSKSTCCASLYTPLPPDNSMHIKWTRDSKTWCEAKVPFSGPVPANPEYMEVHFYRDGHIEVAVTETSSPPRLKLERLHGNSRHQDKSMNVINDEKFARCQRGYF